MSLSLCEPLDESFDGTMYKSPEEESVQQTEKLGSTSRRRQARLYQELDESVRIWT